MGSVLASTRPDPAWWSDVISGLAVHAREQVIVWSGEHASLAMGTPSPKRAIAKAYGAALVLEESSRLCSGTKATTV